MKDDLKRVYDERCITLTIEIDKLTAMLKDRNKEFETLRMQYMN